MTGTIPTGGTGMYTYQWQSSTVGSNGPFTHITGATWHNYAPGPLLVNTWYRRIVMSPPAVNSTSNVVLITVVPPVANNIIAADQTIITGNVPNPLTGTYPTGGNGTYTYQWQASTVGAAGPFINITGSTGQNHSPGPLAVTSWYRRIVTSWCITSTSNVVQITVMPSKINTDGVILAINDKENDLIMDIFPNPTYGNIVFNLDGYSGNFTIVIRNSQGEKIIAGKSYYCEKLYTGKIDLTELVNGIYFIQIITDNKTMIHKIIKQ